MFNLMLCKFRQVLLNRVNTVLISTIYGVRSFSAHTQVPYYNFPQTTAVCVSFRQLICKFSHLPTRWQGLNFITRFIPIWEFSPKFAARKLYSLENIIVIIINQIYIFISMEYLFTSTPPPHHDPWKYIISNVLYASLKFFLVGVGGRKGGVKNLWMRKIKNAMIKSFFF